jgi:hypothetical protein
VVISFVLCVSECVYVCVCVCVCCVVYVLFFHHVFPFVFGPMIFPSLCNPPTLFTLTFFYSFPLQQTSPNDFAVAEGVLSSLRERQLGVRTRRLPCRKVAPVYRPHTPSQFQSRLASSLQRMEAVPRSTVLVPRQYAPRQFEYHHTDASKMIVGTSTGHVLLVNPHADEDSAADSIVQVLHEPGENHLGLSWLRKPNTTHFLAGSASGSIRLVDVSKLHDPKHSPVLYNYQPNFPKLTSVNCNATDRFFLASMNYYSSLELVNYYSFHSSAVGLSNSLRLATCN